MKSLKRIMIAVMLGAVCCLVGCNAEKEKEITSLTLQEDGSIAHTIVESFDRNYYDADELSAMANQKIGDYEGTVGCESVETKDDKVIVKMTYGSGEDYTGFNNREFFSGTVEKADEKGYRFENMVDKDGADLIGEIKSAYAQNHVLAIQTGAGEELSVGVYGNILCVSSNVSISGKKEAYIGATEDMTMSYIIFE